MTVDLILRNARLADPPPGRAKGALDAAPTLDVGIAGGRIVAIEPSLGATAETYDCGGRLVCGGFVETHIHLDKSRIIDRCTPEVGRRRGIRTTRADGSADQPRAFARDGWRGLAGSSRTGG